MFPLPRQDELVFFFEGGIFCCLISYILHVLLKSIYMKMIKEWSDKRAVK